MLYIVTVFAISHSIFYALLCRELAHIIVRHAKDIKTPLNEEIPNTFVDGSVHGTKPKTTTLFRELICRMPGKNVHVIFPEIV